MELKLALLTLALILACKRCYCLLTPQSKQSSYRELPPFEAIEEIDSIESKGSTKGLGGKYQPNWDSLDTRPLPDWYDKSKFGIFIHWGVFSVPGFGSEWFWHSWKTGNKACQEFMKKNYPPNFTYQDFGPQFKAEFFDPNKWASVISGAGAKYVVLTSKHHEGYTMWPSKYSFSWNAQDVGPGRDLVGDLAKAIREKTDVKFGLYHSLYEWFNPLWETDQNNKFKTDDFVRFKTLPELYEVVETYKPEVIWSDGEWLAPDTYWQAAKFLAWLYNDSPVNATVVTNDRWGSTTRCKHGDFYTCSDNYNPGVLQGHKWENCMTVDKGSWGYRRNAQIEDYHKPQELIDALVTTVACGGNLLLNIGPTKEGTIDPVQEERLQQIGYWLKQNGDAIYESKPWKVQNDTVTPFVWYTSNKSRQQVYAIVLRWPGKKLPLASVDAQTVRNVSILGCNETVQWSAGPSGGTIVNFPRPEKIESVTAWTVVFHMKT